MLVNAILIGLVMFLIKVGERFLGKPMFERPLVISAIIGLVLGNLKTGVMMGASLELIFLGIVSIGGATPTDAAVGAVIGTSFAMLLGKGTDVALTLAVPVGLVGIMITRFYNMFVIALLPKMDKHIAEGNVKGALRLHFMHSYLQPLLYGIAAFAAILYGVESMQVIINSIPKVIMDCLDAIANVLPVLGFAMLLNLVWSKELAIYMFLGFILAGYLKLPLIAIAALGTIVAIAVAQVDGAMRKITTSNTSKEEAFFNE